MTTQKKSERIITHRSLDEKTLLKYENLFARAERDSDGYWSDWAQKLSWFAPWHTVRAWKAPYAQWFLGGTLNASYNCLDRHILEGNGEKIAFLFEGELGDTQTVTYRQLYDDVNRCANGLKSLGVVKGDRVAIYMPMIKEAVVGMLACARIGAVHTVVFGGFSSNALKDRINDAHAKVVITADGGYRRGKIIELKKAVDDARVLCPSVEHVVVAKRIGKQITLNKHEHWYDELLLKSEAFCAPEPMDSEDLLFILYTSGTTGKPKGIMHATGGYLTGVYASTELVFGMNADDIYWCTADVGWITGHSYVVYGPLMHGLTQVMYEGAPDYPDKDRFWHIIEKYSVTVFYTAPTAIRAFMKWGNSWLQKFDLSSLRLLGSVGEPINAQAWLWYYESIGNSRCAIVDTWWQTETGSIMIAPLWQYHDLKPGSATLPLPGISACVLDENGGDVHNTHGALLLKQPWPSMLKGIYGDSKRFEETYFKNGDYVTGDGCLIDDDGYLWLQGRIDDVMNIAGHCISTAEVESALIEHHAVAESAVVGILDEIKGEAIVAFVVIKDGQQVNQELHKELQNHVVSCIGSISRPQFVIFVAELPKTRSGKIMRRLLKDIARNRALGDMTTLADEAVIEKIKVNFLQT